MMAETLQKAKVKVKAKENKENKLERSTGELSQEAGETSPRGKGKQPLLSSGQALQPEENAKSLNISQGASSGAGIQYPRDPQDRKSQWWKWGPVPPGVPEGFEGFFQFWE